MMMVMVMMKEEGGRRRRRGAGGADGVGGVGERDDSSSWECFSWPTWNALLFKVTKVLVTGLMQRKEQLTLTTQNPVAAGDTQQCCPGRIRARLCLFPMWENSPQIPIVALILSPRGKLSPLTLPPLRTDHGQRRWVPVEEDTGGSGEKQKGDLGGGKPFPGFK